jgi:hypothetical protein
VIKKEDSHNKSFIVDSYGVDVLSAVEDDDDNFNIDVQLGIDDFNLHRVGSSKDKSFKLQTSRKEDTISRKDSHRKPSMFMFDSSGEEKESTTVTKEKLQLRRTMTAAAMAKNKHESVNKPLPRTYSEINTHASNTRSRMSRVETMQVRTGNSLSYQPTSTLSQSYQPKENTYNRLERKSTARDFLQATAPGPQLSSPAGSSRGSTVGAPLGRKSTFTNMRYTTPEEATNLPNTRSRFSRNPSYDDYGDDISQASMSQSSFAESASYEHPLDRTSTFSRGSSRSSSFRNSYGEYNVNVGRVMSKEGSRTCLTNTMSPNYHMGAYSNSKITSAQRNNSAKKSYAYDVSPNVTMRKVQANNSFNSDSTLGDDDSVGSSRTGSFILDTNEGPVLVNGSYIRLPGANDNERVLYAKESELTERKKKKDSDKRHKQMKNEKEKFTRSDSVDSGEMSVDLMDQYSESSETNTSMSEHGGFGDNRAYGLTHENPLKSSSSKASMSDASPKRNDGSASESKFQRENLLESSRHSSFSTIETRSTASILKSVSGSSLADSHGGKSMMSSMTKSTRSTNSTLTSNGSDIADEPRTSSNRKNSPRLPTIPSHSSVTFPYDSTEIPQFKARSRKADEEDSSDKSTNSNNSKNSNGSNASRNSNNKSSHARGVKDYRKTTDAMKTTSRMDVLTALNSTSTRQFETSTKGSDNMDEFAL